MDYLEGLNPAQRSAVEQIEGPVMIIAGAGSGKTRVLTYRIAHLIEQDVKPYQILSLTFTNKAAREMRSRIESVVGAEAQKIWMGTFHSVFSKILRFEADKIKYPKEFTIYDTDDCKSLIRSIVKDLGLDDKLYRPALVMGRISFAKNKLISYRKYSSHPLCHGEDESNGFPEIHKIYQIYQEKCFRAGAMDFDDLLFNTNVLFQQFPEVLEKYQKRFKYIMVDEFQDTNISQYTITKALADAHNNIAVVGDDAQSIYAFRGANIDNILNFEKDYPKLNVYKLEQNYRSTSTIVQAANAVIATNTEQFEKNSFTDNKSGELIDIYATTTDSDEAKSVTDQIFDIRQQHQAQYKDFAILYRTNVQSRKMEESLRKMSIPYKIFGGMSFYQRKEIKNIIAYLRVVNNPNDEEALKRIINYPKRNIGDTTISKVILHAYNNSILLWDALLSAHTYLPARAATSIKKFTILIDHFRDIAKEKNAYETTNHIAKVSGMMQDLESDRSVEGIARQENMNEMLNGIQEFVENPNHIEDNSLGAFLQEISLLTDLDKDNDQEEDFVSLMTIHSSKGLEFKNVFLVGMEEEIFPSTLRTSSLKELEEERRLFYVAITRAEHRLVLSYALKRWKYGKEIECNPSRFLKEIPNRFLAHRSIIQTQEAPATQNNTNYRSLLESLPKNKVITAHKVSKNFTPSDTSLLAAGMRVEHPKFGFGTVQQVEGKEGNRKAIINFDKEGEKTLLLSFAKLQIHS
ncbi:MAG: UvrD-helicase domain-containing protein [Cytophagales bacterium]|nr:UvrD-helicase domain-containing protein [Cytophagales bacterium]